MWTFSMMKPLHSDSIRLHIKHTNDMEIWSKLRYHNDHLQVHTT
jgi:hypothetical protein